jgi:hypothetical protein
MRRRHPRCSSGNTSWYFAISRCQSAFSLWSSLVLVDDPVSTAFTCNMDQASPLRNSVFTLTAETNVARHYFWDSKIGSRDASTTWASPLTKTNNLSPRQSILGLHQANHGRPRITSYSFNSVTTALTSFDIGPTFSINYHVLRTGSSVPSGSSTLSPLDDL